MTDSLDAMCADYLERLRTALEVVEPSDREQIVAEVSEHLSEARAALPIQNEAGLREVLERLGSPEEIAEAAHPDLEPEVQPKKPATLIWLIAGTLAIVAALALAAITGAFSGSQPEPTSISSFPTKVVVPVVVPEVVGMSTAQAAGALQAVGLYNSVDNLNCSTKIHNGHVVAEAPPPGSRVARGTRISIQVTCSR